MLEVEKLNQYYGESHTLWDMDLSIPKGARVCVMGRNGVGKTTLLKSIMGGLKVKSGIIRFSNEDLTLSAPADERRVHGRRDVVAQTLLEILVAVLAGSAGGDEAEVTVGTEARDVHVDVRAAAAKALDPSFVDQATSAMEWAGGSLRVGDDGVHVELPGVRGEAT